MTRWRRSSPAFSTSRRHWAKTDTLAALGAEPIATLRSVQIDLREDWPTALRAAGFDPARPTAWIAEGLLIYLPPDAQDKLFDTITGLSAPGSALATEYVPGMADFDAEKARARTQPMRDMGLDIDMASLVYPGARNHVLDYLAKTGWHVAGFSRDELYVASGLEVPEPRDDDPIGEVIYVSATLD